MNFELGIKPLWNQIIVTAEKYNDDEIVMDGVIIDTISMKSKYKEVQRVLAVSEMVEKRGDIKVGDLIMIDPKKYLTQEWYEKQQQGSLSEIDPSVHHVAFTKFIKYPILKYRNKPIVMKYGEYEGEVMKLFDNDIEYIINEA